VSWFCNMPSKNPDHIKLKKLLQVVVMKLYRVSVTSSYNSSPWKNGAAIFSGRYFCAKLTSGV
jgi:hypothetical protein